MARDGVATQLYLVLPVTGSTAASLDARVGAAQRGGAVATVLIEPDVDNPPSPSDLAKAVSAIQQRGVATLVAGDASLARVVKADGTHLSVSKAPVAAYGEARETLGTRFIVGVDVGRTRHDAMSLGEAGADYVAFGIPAHVEDRDTARGRRLDLIGWWSEIFEIPCVAFDVETPEEAEDLARAGADFVAVRLPADIAVDAVAGHLAPFFAALDLTAPAT